MHRPPFTLISCDAGVISQTTPAQLTALLEDEDAPTTPTTSTRETEHLLEHMDPSFFTTPPSPTYVDVSIDAKSCLAHLYATALSQQPDHEAI